MPWCTHHDPRTTTEAADTQRRVPSPPLIARKASGPEAAGAGALPQRLGNQGTQRFMDGPSGSSSVSDWARRVDEGV